MPVYVPVEDFRRAVEAYIALISAGIGEAGALPPGMEQLVAFYFDVDERSEQLLSSQDIDVPLVMAATTDIEDTLGAAVSGAGSERFAEVRSKPRFGDETESREIAQEKYEIVESGFDIEGLRSQVQLKASSKNPLLSTMEWELVSKLKDDDFRDITGSSPLVAHFRIVLREGPFGANEVPPVVFTLTQSDVRFARRVLERLDGAFDEGREGST